MDTINYAIESDDEGNFVIEESHSENGYLVDEWTNITGDLTDGGYGPPQLSWDKLVDVLWDLQMEGGWITADQLTELLENRDLSVDADNYLYQ